MVGTAEHLNLRGRIERVNQAYQAYPGSIRPFHLPKPPDTAASVLLRASQDVERLSRKEEFQELATLSSSVWRKENRDRVKEKGEGVDLAPLDPQDRSGSVRVVVIQFLNAAGGVLGLDAGEEYFIASRGGRAYREAFVHQNPEYHQFENVLGGSSEGGLLVGELFSSLLEGETLPPPHRVEQGVRASYRTALSLTALNISPQKVIDSLIRHQVNPFQSIQTPDFPVAQVKPVVWDYVEKLGTDIFTNPDITNDEIGEVELAIKIAEMVPTELIDGERDKINRMLYALTPAVRASFFEKFSDEPRVQQMKVLVNHVDDVVKVLSMYRKYPRDHETMTCPAVHGQVFHPWYTLVTGMLQDWYKREYSDLQLP